VTLEIIRIANRVGTRKRTDTYISLSIFKEREREFGKEDEESIIYTPKSANALHDLTYVVVVQYMYCIR